MSVKGLLVVVVVFWGRGYSLDFIYENISGKQTVCILIADAAHNMQSIFLDDSTRLSRHQNSVPTISILGSRRHFLLENA